MELLLMKQEHLEGVATLERLCFGEPWSAKTLELLLGDGAFAVVCTEGQDVLAYGGMLSVLDEGQVPGKLPSCITGGSSCVADLHRFGVPIQW